MSLRPTVFVSSTFYDLKHLRAELLTFIDGFGYTPLLSEHHSFPIDPDSSTVDACRRAVVDHADMFVLIVGGRYGSVVDGSRSITNLEYIEAAAKGVPIFAFVEARVLDVLPVWRSNRSGDFATVVDSPRLFEFIESFYSGGERWVFSFRSPHEIKDALTSQWARLMQSGLDLRRRLAVPTLPRCARDLRGEALRLVLEQPDRWEFLLFADLIETEIESHVELERDLFYALSDVPPDVTLDFDQVVHWLRSQPSLLLTFQRELTTVIKALGEAMGAHEAKAPSADHILYVVRRFDALYRQTLSHALDCQRRIVPEEANAAAKILGGCWSRLVFDVKGAANALGALARRVGKKETDEFEYKWSLIEPDFTGWPEALAQLGNLKNR